jgi:hypothetical protein
MPNGCAQSLRRSLKSTSYLPPKFRALVAQSSGSSATPVLDSLAARPNDNLFRALICGLDPKLFDYGYVWKRQSRKPAEAHPDQSSVGGMCRTSGCVACACRELDCMTCAICEAEADGQDSFDRPQRGVSDSALVPARQGGLVRRHRPRAASRATERAGKHIRLWCDLQSAIPDRSHRECVSPAD